MKSRATGRPSDRAPFSAKAIRHQRVRASPNRRTTRHTTPSTMSGGNGWPSSMSAVSAYSTIRPTLGSTSELEPPTGESVGLRGSTGRACGRPRRGVLVMAHKTTLAPVARGGAAGAFIGIGDKEALAKGSARCAPSAVRAQRYWCDGLNQWVAPHAVAQ